MRVFGFSIALASLMLTAACSDPYKHPLPDTSESLDDKKFLKAVEKLSPEDQKALTAYLFTREVAAGFGNAAAFDAKTIREAVDTQRAWEEEERAKEEAEAKEKARAEQLAKQALKEAEERKKALRESVTVAVSELGLVPKNRFQEALAVRLVFKNLTDRRVEGVKGRLLFDDLFGERIKTVSIAYDAGLDPNETREWPGQLEYNQFMDADKKLANTPLERMKVTWDPEQIIYAEPAAAAGE